MVAVMGKAALGGSGIRGSEVEELTVASSTELVLQQLQRRAVAEEQCRLLALPSSVD